MVSTLESHGLDCTVYLTLFTRHHRVSRLYNRSWNGPDVTYYITKPKYLDKGTILRLLTFNFTCMSDFIVPPYVYFKVLVY